MAVSEGRTGVYGMSELDMGSCLPVLLGCRARKVGRKRVCRGEKQIREREEGHRDAWMEILSCSGRETASAGQGLSRKGAEKGWYHRVCAMDRDACMPRRIPEHLLEERPGNACTEKTVCPGRADSFETVMCSSFTGQLACASCFQAKANAMPGIPIFWKVPGDGAGVISRRIRRRDRRPDVQTAAQGSGIPSLSSLITGMDWKGWGISLRLRCPLQDHRRPSREPAPEPLRRSE